ncbi:hypothetical protein ACQ4PT_024087 [Festuca glaucescens]
MIELGKLFAARGLAVTIVIARLPFEDTGARGPFLAAVTAANPSISFHCFPQVDLPPVHSNYPEAITFEVARASNPHLRDFLTSASPSPTVLVVDAFCGVALDVAAELHIPAYFFYTSGAEVLAFFLHLPVLHAQATASFRDLGEELLHVPGITSLPASHTAKPLMDRDDAAYQGFLRASTYLCRSSSSTPAARSSRAPSTRSAPASARLPASRRLPSIASGCCLGLFSVKQISAIAVGLEASGQRFLWVVRSPPSDDPAMKFQKTPEPDLDALLPQGFLDRTKGSGLIVKSWAPQRDVLAHDAVGGFVTHCGWNSVLESVMAGVPMLAWPLYAEQRMNRVFLDKELGLAVAVEGYDRDDVVEAGELASKIPEGLARFTAPVIM